MPPMAPSRTPKRTPLPAQVRFGNLAGRRPPRGTERWHTALGLLAAGAVVMAGILARPWLLGLGHGVAGPTFYPCLVLAALACVIVPGTIGAGLAALAALDLLLVPRPPGDVVSEILTTLPISLAVLAISLCVRRLLWNREQLGALARDQQMILDCTAFGITRVQGRVIQWANRGAEALLGWGPGQLTGQSTRVVYPDDESFAAYGRLAAAARADGTPLQWQLPLRRRDGETVWVDCNGLWADPDHDILICVITDVSAHRRAEAALRASEAFLARTGAIAGVGGWQFDVGQERLIWSDVLCRLHDMPSGYRPTLTEVLAFVEPDSRPALRAAFDAGIADGAPWDLELPIVTAAGQRRVLRIVGEAEREAGAVVRLAGVVKDVSVRHAMRHDLARTHELMRVTLDSIGDGVITAGADGRVQFVNPAAERLTGWRVTEAERRRLDLVFAAYDEETGDPVTLPAPGLRLRLTARDGTERGIEGTASPIVDADRRHCGTVLVFRDVTEQRRLAQTIRQREQQFADANARLAAVFRNSADAMIVARIAGDGRYVYEAVNTVWESLTGVGHATAIGLTPADCLPPAVARLVLAGWDRCARERCPVAYEFQTDRRGREDWEAVAAPVIEPDGRIERLMAVVRNVTGRKHLEASVRQLQRMEAVGQLTAGVAHDFNNLLQAIMGALDLLAENATLDSEALECVAMADAAAERGATLVHRLLAFSRKQALDPVLLRAEDVFADLATLLASTLGARIRLETAIAPGTWSVHADAGQLENCLFNLAINARDAMPVGGRLRLGADNVSGAAALAAGLPAGDYVRFTVSDTGGGMTPETLARAQEPFFTTKPIGKGTGLGLSMVSGFARQSGGDVRIDSAVGQGTTVSLWLPRAIAAEAPPPATAAADSAIRRRPLVMVVDDDPSVRRMLTLLLDRAGMDALAYDGAEAALLALQAGAACDLMITDQSMPGLPGSDLILRVARLRPGLPAMLITGQDMVSGLDALIGRVAILRKPFRQDVFLEQARSLLSRREDSGDVARLASRPLDQAGGGSQSQAAASAAGRPHVGNRAPA